MKVGFIGVGRMGSAMAAPPARCRPRRRRLQPHARPRRSRSADAGAKVVGSIAELPRAWRRRLSPCWPTTRRSTTSSFETGGLLASLPKGGIHVCAGTHGVAVIRKIEAVHAAGRPDARRRADARPARTGRRAAPPASSPAGPAEAIDKVQAAVRRASADAPSRPAPIRKPPPPSRSPTTSCSAAPSRRWAKAFSLVRKYGVEPSVVLRGDDRRAVHCVGLQGLRQDHRRREPTSKVGQMAVLGPEGRQSRARRRRSSSACRCRAATSGATG